MPERPAPGRARPGLVAGTLLLLGSTGLAIALVHGIFRAVAVGAALLGGAALVRRAGRRPGTP